MDILSKTGFRRRTLSVSSSRDTKRIRFHDKLVLKNPLNHPLGVSARDPEGVSDVLFIFIPEKAAEVYTMYLTNGYSL